MSMTRQFTRWQQVAAASGTPGSRQRRAWDTALATRPAVAYWGDSWFSTPLYRNLAWHSFTRIDGVALRLGRPGLTAARMCTPAACRDTAQRLGARGFDLLAVSIGGNDCLGPRLAPLFKGTGTLPVADAVARVVDAGVFTRLRAQYARLLTAMARDAGHVRVVGHGYAPLAAGAIGREGAVSIKNLGLAAPLVGNVGPWLWPAVRHVFDDDPPTVAAFARQLLTDGFRDQVLAPTRADWPDRFAFLDASSLGQAADAAFWYDEIHPTPAGFSLLAAGFNPLLRAALPPTKQAAVA